MTQDSSGCKATSCIVSLQQSICRLGRFWARSAGRQVPQMGACSAVPGMQTWTLLGRPIPTACRRRRPGTACAGSPGCARHYKMGPGLSPAGRGLMCPSWRRVLAILHIIRRTKATQVQQPSSHRQIPHNKHNYTYSSCHLSQQVITPCSKRQGPAPAARAALKLRER